MAHLPEIELELLQNVEAAIPQPAKSRISLFLEMVRFAIVGIINTAIDLFILNCLLLLLPTHSTGLLVLYNSVAYTIGALNSFLLNKYWTFHDNQREIKAELLRFAVVNLFGLVCNDVLLWLAAGIAHPFMMSALVWANFSKVFAIGGTAAISFLGMRLWVFAGKTRQGDKKEENFSAERQQAQN